MQYETFDVQEPIAAYFFTKRVVMQGLLCALLVVLSALFVNPSRVGATPTTLAPNDVVIVTANSDTAWSSTACSDSAPGGTNSNAIDFLLRKDIGAGTVFKVTDNAWTGSALATSEGRITYTAPTDLPAGSIIRYSDCLYNQGISGWVRSTPVVAFDPSIAGDTLLIYQGTEASPSFVYGFGFRSNSWINSGIPSSNNSHIPPALSAASPTAYAAPGTTSGPRNYQYTGPTTGVYAANFLTSLKATANWTGTGGTSTGQTFGPIPTTFDATRPTITSVVRLSPTATITNASNVTFRITTSEPIQGLSSSNITTATTGTLTYTSLSVVSVSSSEYDVTLNGLSGEGTVALASYTGNMIDTHGNPALDHSFISQSFTRDVTPPTATVTSRLTNQTSPSLSGTVSDSSASVSVEINGSTYDAVVSGMSWYLSAGAIQPALADGAYDIKVTATDIAGNASTNTAVNGLVIDTTPLTASIGRAHGQATQTNNNNFEFIVTFNKPIVSTSFSASDMYVEGTTASVIGLTQVSQTSWRVTLSGATPGDIVTVRLPGAVVQDQAGNANQTSTGTANGILYDIIAPVVTINTIPVGDASPRLSGFVSDQTALVAVVINGKTYQAVNTAGVWVLDQGMISPALLPGSYDVRIIATDIAGNTATLSQSLTVAAIPSKPTSSESSSLGAPNTGVHQGSGLLMLGIFISMCALSYGIMTVIRSLE